MCQDHDSKDFLLKAESQLFKFRFQCMSEDELTKSLRRTDSHLKKVQHNYLVPSIHDFQKLKNIRDMFRLITTTEQRWKLIVRRYLSGDSERGFQIPFFIVPQLVAKRRVELDNGLAFVPFCKLEDVISQLWYQLLVWGIDRACRIQKTFLQDKRMRVLTRHIQVMFRKHHRTFEDSPLNENYLSHDQVSEVMTLFPPCMLHVHQILTTRHRLQHHARIQYTLFLKEIGMPVHEALMFWRKEYSNSVEPHDGCPHHWQQDGRRYTYNIRHLYGLEGACINYRGHCCATLQNAACGVGEQGGCPFKCFDSDHLDILLQREKILYSRETIHQLSSEGRYSEACRSLFVEKSKRLIQETEVHGKTKPTVTESGFEENGMIVNDGHMVTNNTVALTSIDHRALDSQNITECPDTSRICSYTGIGETSWRHSHRDTNCNSSSDRSGTGEHPYNDTDMRVESLPGCGDGKFESVSTCPQKQCIEERTDQESKDISKPSQFYFSLRKLVEGLKKCEKKHLNK
ncbi:DNA primase large subunit-like isoform X2 [Pecten maximus]|nr:DNA primase large subunit-like isoform X2 [Pecten maximus]